MPAVQWAKSSDRPFPNSIYVLNLILLNQSLETFYFYLIQVRIRIEMLSFIKPEHLLKDHPAIFFHATVQFQFFLGLNGPFCFVCSYVMLGCLFLSEIAFVRC